MTLDPKKKIAGLLVPLFALRGRHDLGVGDTEAISDLLDWAAGNNFRVIQILPVNETGGDHSPYNVLSAFALDPLTITTHPSWIPELTPGDYRIITGRHDLESLRNGAVNYTAVGALKRELLEAAWTRFRNEDARVGRVKLFTRFLEEHEEWIQDYTLYRVLLEMNGSLEELTEWPEVQRNAQTARVWQEGLPKKERQALEERRLFFAFVQWIAFSQWSSVADHAETLGMALIGDVPVGVAAGGADVFARPEEFDSSLSCGAPPETFFRSDPFTEQWGQNWGFPLYKWKEMARTNFRWWRLRIRLLRSVFHLLRVDHALGFFRIYSFPWPPRLNAEFTGLSEADAAKKTGGRLPGFVDYDDSTPEHRSHNKIHGEVLLGLLGEEIGLHRLIAEDLGEVAPYVRPVMAQMEIPGFKIPMWERFPDGNMKPGEMYDRISVATYATHDHAPMLTQWEEWQAGLLRGGEEARGCLKILTELLRFAGMPELNPLTPFAGKVHETLLEGLLACNSWIVIPMITDLFGSSQRFNVPGAVGSANWTARIEIPVSEWNSRHEDLLRWWRSAVARRGRI